MREMLRSERPRGATPVLPAAALFVAALFVAGMLAACGSDVPSPPAPSPTEAALVADVDVGGGRTIHIICEGPTSTSLPTVVFENGAGPNMSTWSSVVEEIIPTDRACTYDRAGVGRSTAPPDDRTTQDQVEDLEATLQGAGVTGPIVLVAHSRGAWNTILYSAEDAHQVVGVVLVDADPPGLDARWLEEVPPETVGENPDITEARMIMSDHSSDPSVTQERLDLEASQALVEAAPGFGARPTEILWATKSGATDWPASFDADLVARLNGAFEQLRGDIEALAENPNVTHVASGHSIQEEQPDAVVQAIRRVLEAV